jgi:hypothetical protein
MTHSRSDFFLSFSFLVWMHCILFIPGYHFPLALCCCIISVTDKSRLTPRLFSPLLPPSAVLISCTAQTL